MKPIARGTQPPPPQPHRPSRPAPPYTVREALYGNQGLEPCVSMITHAWPDQVHERLAMFTPIMDRPKQAIHHLLELFILHVCQLDRSWDHEWVSSVVRYLSAAAPHLIPAVPPTRATQWNALLYDRRGRQTGVAPQAEEAYPKSFSLQARRIMDIIASYSASFKEPDVTREEVASLTGLMDEPAKTAVMVYAWFLHSYGVKNGWLRPFLTPALGRRERPREAPLLESEYLFAGGRLARVDEELHTLFCQAFIDRKGHLVWYTVRQATTGEIIGRPAYSYARGNSVRIHSSKDVSKSIQIHHSQICNRPRLDMRLWESWSHNARGVGPCRSLANPTLAGPAIRFDKPVIFEDALAVGFRVVRGSLINPRGKRMLVSKGSDGLYKARLQLLRGSKQEPISWSPGMKFA